MCAQSTGRGLITNIRCCFEGECWVKGRKPLFFDIGDLSEGFHPNKVLDILAMFGSKAEGLGRFLDGVGTLMLSKIRHASLIK